MKNRFIAAAIILCISFSFLLCIFSIPPAHAAAAHVVISQIQIGGVTANEEFVELYNPTDIAINMSGWRLSRKASASASFSTLVSNLSGSIAPHGYLLIAHPSYTNAAVSADILYSATSSGIAKDNTVALFSDAGITVVDKVGMGFAGDKETQTFQNPENNQSIVRKASVNSSASTLLLGGLEEHDGNGFDTDNNANDFVLFTTSMPRNSKTPAAPPFISPTLTVFTDSPTPTVSLTPTEIPTPTETLSPSPTPTMIPSLTLTPTETPFPTATPTVEPTAIPTVTLTPTISVPTISLTPTDSLTLTPTVTLAPKPTITMKPTPTFMSHHFPFHAACSWKFISIRIHGMTFKIPLFHCERENRHRR